MKEIEIVRQVTPHDCGIACLRMVTGKSEAEIVALLGHGAEDLILGNQYMGVTEEEVAFLLLKLGYAPVHLWTRSSLKRWTQSWEFRLTSRDLIQDWPGLLAAIGPYPALLSVESDRFEGDGHFVVWDPARQQIIDPSKAGMNLWPASRFENHQVWGAIVVIDTLMPGVRDKDKLLAGLEEA